MHALAPRVDVFLHVPHPSIRSIRSALFTLSACQCNVERLEVARKKCEGELAFRKDTYPPQEADGAEKARELAWGAESGEQLTQERADGTVRLGMHVLHSLDVRKTRGQSRGVRCEVERLLEMTGRGRG
jgi:hypothetical protein